MTSGCTLCDVREAVFCNGCHVWWIVVLVAGYATCLDDSVCTMPAYSFLIASLSSRLGALQLSHTSHALHSVHTATGNMKASSCLRLLGVAVVSRTMQLYA